MKLIVGLGNPGKEYEKNRHNAGFLAMDYFLRDKQTIKCSSKFHGHICEMHFTAATHKTGPIKIFFLKPQTFMNNSGEVVSEVVKFYKLNPVTDLLVIHDEIDLKFGFVKFAFDSSPAGHNGVKNIVEQLGTQEFSRIRIGVESRVTRTDMPTDKFVLQNFAESELLLLEQTVFPEVAKQINTFLVAN